MKFENNEFIYAFLLLLIPVIIHLLNFFKPKKILFSKVFFLKVLKENKTRIHNVRDRLVLISRVLVLLFLVLAFISILYLKNNVLGSEVTKEFIFIDNSLSMSVQNDDGISGLDVSKSYALDVLKKGDAQYALNTSDFNKSGLYFQSSESAIVFVSGIDFSTSGVDLKKIDKRVNHVLELSGVDTSVVQCVVLSDFQKGLTHLNNKEGNRWRFVVVNSGRQISNHKVDSIWLEDPFLRLDEPMTLRMKYVYSTPEAGAVNARLFVDGQQVSNTDINSNIINDVVEFNFSLRKEGIHKCYISLDDNIGFDNKFYFTLNVNPLVNIVVVKEDTSSSFVAKVFRNEPSFKVTMMPTGGLQKGVLQNSDLIVLDGISVNNLDFGQFTDLLKTTSLLYVPSPLLKESDYQFTWVSSFFNATAIYDDSTSYPILISEDEQFYRGVFTEIPKKGEFQTAKKFLSLKGDGFRSLLKLSDGTPLILNKNSFFVLSLPLDASYGNFHRNTLFVPVLYKIAMQSAGLNKTLYHRITDQIMLDDAKSTGAKVYLKRDGKDVLLDVGTEGNKMFFNSEDYELEQGFYDVVVGDSVVLSIAINLGKEESLMEFYSKQELEELYPNATIESINSVDDVKKRLSEMVADVSLWKYCIILALLFLLSEILLIKYLK